VEKEVAKVISLGAGVQSSALLLLSDRGEIARADFAVFADTQAEPQEVYDWLEILKKTVSIPIYTASKGDIIADSYYRLEYGDKWASLPFWIKGAGEDNIAQRQCTNDYKIQVVQSEVRRVLGYAKGKHMKHTVEMMIGISIDESIRMKDSRTPWIKNKYPLIFDKPMHRQQCIEYVNSIINQKPPRSACYICPFKTNDEWKHIRDNYPDLWTKAIEFDNRTRQLQGFKGQTYLHKDRVPLEEANLEKVSNQLDLFGNECEGMCGV
jgi:hypothetical protein